MAAPWRDHSGRQGAGDGRAAGTGAGAGGDPAVRASSVLAAAAAVLEALVPAGGCPGTLVVHLDGSPAACTEELDGRCCLGSDQAHLGMLGCGDVLGVGGCEECVPADGGGDDPAWRHAVRAGVLAARPRLCRRHRLAS